MNLKNIFFKALKIEDPRYKSIDLIDNQLIIGVDFKLGSTFWQRY